VTAWLERWAALVRRVTRVQGAGGQAQLVQWLARPCRPQVLAFVNAHAMNASARDASFFDALCEADTLLRDGIGMAWLMGLLNQPPGLNLNGTDFIPRLLRACAGQPIALFGTQEPWLSRARAAIERDLAPASVCVTADGFLPTARYVDLAAAHRPRLIVLAMGMPRQEQVARALRAALFEPCVIVCGGAILDFLGGRFPRAPRYLRQAGLEWAWRLGLEPRRLFRRYVLGNPLFLARALWLAASPGPCGRPGETDSWSARS